MKVALGTDHAGFDLKNQIRTFLEHGGHEVLDLGAHEFDPDDDYPDFALAVANSIAQGHAEKGVLCCGSGVGASIAANKVVGVRAAMCHDTYSAHQGVEHDDMNILCVGARVIGIELCRELVASFINARFTGESRHQRRLDKVKAIESTHLSPSR